MSGAVRERQRTVLSAGRAGHRCEGKSPVNFFAKLFGRRQSGTDSAARSHARRHGEMPAGTAGGADGRPLFRDEISGPAGADPAARRAASVDHDVPGRIGFQGPPTPSAGGGQDVLACAKCGNSNAATSRFCSHCGNPLRHGRIAEGASETTSTISISGIEAYEAEITGQQATPVLSPEAQAAVDALPPGSALLVVRRGPNAGSRFLLDAELTTAGRHPESDIFLDDVTVSRRHVEFRGRPEGGFTVSDVGSLNGTYVNRERIDAVQLAQGDEVQIGKYRLLFLVNQHVS
jgi:hypothetical protein